MMMAMDCMLLIPPFVDCLRDCFDLIALHGDPSSVHHAFGVHLCDLPFDDSHLGLHKRSAVPGWGTFGSTLSHSCLTGKEEVSSWG